jgi:hypothetical protein
MVRVTQGLTFVGRLFDDSKETMIIAALKSSGRRQMFHTPIYLESLGSSEMSMTTPSMGIVQKDYPREYCLLRGRSCVIGSIVTISHPTAFKPALGSSLRKYAPFRERERLCGGMTLSWRM